MTQRWSLKGSKIDNAVPNLSLLKQEPFPKVTTLSLTSVVPFPSLETYNAPKYSRALLFISITHTKDVC